LVSVYPLSTPHHTSPLFPYTTLFRSKPIKPHTAMTWRSHLTWINPRIGDVPLESVNNLTLKELVSNMSEAGFSPKTMHNYIQVVDRKSTRLNSSHGSISYAVFCLKKK